jgi:hypothetical protein
MERVSDTTVSTVHRVCIKVIMGLYEAYGKLSQTNPIVDAGYMVSGMPGPG